jgi:DNA-binding PadR family transcriptional regulator
VPEPPKLTTTSYVVLGLVAAGEPITSYEMKRGVAQSIGYLWHFPHSQLYAEPARLAGFGLLDEEAEETGRKRRRYRITPAGRQALAQWLAEAATDPTELRDLGLLKLFFGDLAGESDVVALAEEQRRAHEHRHHEYQQLRTSVYATATRSQLAALEAGLRYEAMASAFWAEVAQQVTAERVGGDRAVAL